ncbi:FAD binding domain-containing protein [Pseudomonas sp. K1(2024)]|uniref:FAD binding domain-containing protein n=1 Tax=Pseudomonas boreofloridensis TaxID=3064348 RepID=A0ABV4Z9G8_9PSED|nr:FAD binding domain-containing protein [Pseudomonas sp. K13]MDO7901509.1 FAD binding domain-containing protein [Pseudomonas sp. K13]
MNTTSASRRAIIVGGSLGGLFTANLLLRNGWQVQVFERVADALTGRGAGIVTHPQLLDGLLKAGVKVDDDLGVRVSTRVTLHQDGTVEAEHELPQLLTAWSRMYHVLHQALPAEHYLTGRSVRAVQHLPDRARVILDDNSVHEADLVVAADGLRSRIRQQLMPEAQLQYAGYVAWRGLVEEQDLSDTTRQTLFDRFAFCLPPHEQILGYPVAGALDSTRVGQRRYNFVWYRATDEQQALADMLTDEHGKRWPDGIPPGLIRRQVIQDMRQAAHRLLAPAFTEVVEKTSQPLFQPIYDLQVPRMNHGRIALLGDAAFVARPHCGMGVAKAAGDAMELVNALASTADVSAALASYSQRRTPYGAAIVQHARHLGAYMQAQLLSDMERTMAERYRTPEAVMRETAVDPEF